MGSLISGPVYLALLIDMDRLNYDTWREFFNTHCVGYSVFDHLVASNTVRTIVLELDEIDAIVKQWICDTIAQSLLQNVFKVDSIVADAWQAIEDLFRENKESKAMKIDNELRSITISNSTIVEY